MKIAINTPNGNIGRIVTAQMLDAGADVVLLTRSPDKVKEVEARGATVHVGDMNDGDYVTKATAGVDTLFWLTPADYQSEDMRADQRRLAEIAANAVKANNIQRVLDLSSVGAQHESGTGPIAGLYDVEKALETTDAHLVHLRPGFFMENYFMSLETIAADGNIYMPVPGDCPMWMIATHDVGTVASEWLRKDNWSKREVVEIVGPEEHTFAQAAKTIGEAIGREVIHVEVTPEQTKEAMTAMGVTGAVADVMNEMYGAFSTGHVRPEGEPRRTSTSLASFAANALKPALAG